MFVPSAVWETIQHPVTEQYLLDYIGDYGAHLQGEAGHMPPPRDWQPPAKRRKFDDDSHDFGDG